MIFISYLSLLGRHYHTSIWNVCQGSCVKGFDPTLGILGDSSSLKGRAQWEVLGRAEGVSLEVIVFLFSICIVLNPGYEVSSCLCHGSAHDVLPLHKAWGTKATDHRLRPPNL